jgi:hypothetical protein
MLRLTSLIISMFCASLAIAADGFRRVEPDEVSVELAPGLVVEFFMNGDRVRTIWLRIGDKRLIVPFDDCEAVQDIEHGTAKTTILPRQGGANAIALEFFGRSAPGEARGKRPRYRVVIVGDTVQERVVFRPTGRRGEQKAPLCSS